MDRHIVFLAPTTHATAASNTHAAMTAETVLCDGYFLYFSKPFAITAAQRFQALRQPRTAASFTIPYGNSIIRNVPARAVGWRGSLAIS